MVASQQPLARLGHAHVMRSRRSNAVPHSSSKVRNCRLKVGCEILARRAPAEMLPHSTMQTNARSSARSSKGVHANPA